MFLVLAFKYQNLIISPLHLPCILFAIMESQIKQKILIGVFIFIAFIYVIRLLAYKFLTIVIFVMLKIMYYKSKPYILLVVC
jgi:hypothetical protein